MSKEPRLEGALCEAGAMVNGGTRALGGARREMPPAGAGNALSRVDHPAKPDERKIAAALLILESESLAWQGQLRA